jgi:hypothetical protein
MSQPLLALPSSVEERITGWIRIQEAQKLRPKAPGPTITLSRQFGCEGFPLALALKAQLEAGTRTSWTIFDRALIDRVAADEGLSRRLLADLGDAPQLLEGLGFHPRGLLTTDQAFRKIAPFIAKVAREGHAIIMGRGGAILCAKLPNAFHFRLVAGFAWRVATLARRTGLSNEEAVALVKTQGRLRARFIQEALGADVEEASHYDALFNNEHHTVDAMAAAIVAYVRQA